MIDMQLSKPTRRILDFFKQLKRPRSLEVRVAVASPVQTAASISKLISLEHGELSQKPVRWIIDDLHKSLCQKLQNI
jgi:hypothetical protein